MVPGNKLFFSTVFIVKLWHGSYESRVLYWNRLCTMQGERSVNTHLLIPSVIYVQTANYFRRDFNFGLFTIVYDPNFNIQVLWGRSQKKIIGDLVGQFLQHSVSAYRLSVWVLQRELGKDKWPPNCLQ